jgi:hypothetical protein
MNAGNQISFDFSLPSPTPPAAPLTLNSPTFTQPLAVATQSREIIVDSLRLSDRGDISNSYSADLIDNGRIRKPFRYNGQLYVCTSSASGCYPHGIREAEAYRLLSATLFDGPTTDLQTKVGRDNGASARSDPNGFYHAITITKQGQQYVLTGPPLTFLPNIPRT